MYKIYKIKEGDTLDSIARMSNTTVDILMEINGINKDYVPTVNAYLIVPTVQERLFDNYVVEKGDTMYAIASKLGVSVDDLLNLNGLLPYDYIYPNQELLVPKEGVKFIITKEGETLASSANRLNTSVGELLLQNENIYLLPSQLLVYKKS